MEKNLNILYKETLAQLIEELAGGFVGITTDLWTSIANRGYITVTASYFLPDWTMKTKVLATTNLDDKHTGIFKIK